MIEKYIYQTYGSNKNWFVDEVRQIHQTKRINEVLNIKNYLDGIHKVRNRKDTVYKGEVYASSKMVLQTAKSIILFHNSYLVGKRISLTGDKNIVKAMNDIYKRGLYHQLNYKIIDKINKYGDVFEYVYYSDGQINSKIINPEDAYPVYDNNKNYIAFIEYWCDALSNIETYIIYYPDRVEKWSNEGGLLKLIEEYTNVSGLPVHYHNINDSDECFGKSILTDIIPILDKIEYLLNKMDDAIYTHSLNPMPVSIGQKLSGSVDADACGYVLNLEDGDFKYAIANLDSASIKLLYDSLMQQLMMVACVPSHIFGQNNVSNVSEVSLQMLYQNLENKAIENEVYIRYGLHKRCEAIERLLNKQGIYFNDEWIEFEFNYNRPTNQKELLEQMKIQRDMGAISIETIVEKSEITNDVSIELSRLSAECILNKDSQKVDENKDEDEE